MNNAPGKIFLQVVGILLVVGGAFGILGALVLLAGGGLLGAAAGASGEAAAGAAIAGIFFISSIVALVCSVFNLIVGIFGIKNCNRPEKSGTCFKLGIAMLIFTLINVIISLVSAQMNPLTIVSSLASFLLPVLYTIGAKKNMGVPVQ